MFSDISPVHKDVSDTRGTQKQKVVVELVPATLVCPAHIPGTNSPIAHESGSLRFLSRKHG